MKAQFGRYEPATRADAVTTMDGAGQGEPEDQHAAPTTPPPPSNPQQQQDSDAPGAAASEMAQLAAAASLMTATMADTAAKAARDGVAAAGTQSANPGTAWGANPPSTSHRQQTVADASSNRQSSDAPFKVTPNPPATGQSQPVSREASGLRWTDPMTVHSNTPGAQAQPANVKAAPGAGPVASPQQQLTGPPQQQQQQPQQYQHPHPHPHPQHHPQPQHAPAPIPVPPSAPPPPPGVHPHHGAPHPQPEPQPQPQPHSYPHQHPTHPNAHAHGPPPPPPPHLQQPAPHPHTPAQIPHQYQQHQQHHHPHHHQQPPSSSAPGTPLTPLPPLHHPHAPQFHSHHQPPPQPQSQPVLRSQAPHPRASISKPLIMDPPNARKPQGGTMGFPSPTQDYATLNPKFLDDCTRLNFAIQQSIPEAARRIVRDHWEKCLLGSEFHQAFILNASIHHASPSIVQRAVRDFGSKMVAESKHDLMAHFTAEALDEVAELIISKASDSFLDKCLAKRLLTIEAKPLINALATAERLGYEPGDVIQDEQHERVIPQEAYPGAAAATNGPLPRVTQPPLTTEGRAQLQCMKCFRTFMHTSAFDHHARREVCSEIPPTPQGFSHSCPHCGQGFTKVGDLQAHLDYLICGDFGQPRPKLRTAPAAPASPAVVTSAAQTPTTNGIPRNPQSTPAHPSVAKAAAATPGSTGSGIAADPYGHLSEREIQLMNEELKAAEEKYAPRFAEANLIADENARKARVEGLRNSFGTKQSMIRKKFGVRLRERRTKAEIQAERQRLGLMKAEKAKEKAREKARASTGVHPHASSPLANVDPASRPAGGSGWTAANTPRANAAWSAISDEHNTKRRRTDEGGGYQSPYKTLADETPTRKTLPLLGTGGGEAGSSAAAAAHGPTAPASHPARVYEQAGARVEIHEPSQADHPMDGTTTTGPASGTATPSGSATDVNGPVRGLSTSSENHQPVVIEDDSSSDDDEDIPSTLPSHVRKSLAAGSTSLLQQNP